MPAGIIAVTVVGVGLIAFIAILAALDRADRTSDVVVADRSDILQVVTAEGSLRTDPWQLETAHRTPTTPYTPEQAHTAMQQHRECGTDICGAKYTAFWALADAGKLIADERAVR